MILSGAKYKWLITIGILLISTAIFIPMWVIKETALPLTVRYRNIPEGLIVVSPYRRVIEATVRGKRARVNKVLKKGPYEYEVDLTGAHAGMNIHPVNINPKIFPRRVVVIKSNVSSLQIDLDFKVRKKLPVRVITSGKPETGYLVAESISDPAQVWVEGPRTILEPMREVKTKPVELNNINESIQQATALDLPEGIYPLYWFGEIIADIVLKDKIITKSFDEVLVKGRNSPYAFSIKPNVLQLTLKGPQHDLDSCGPDKGLEVFIDLSGLLPGFYSRPAVIRLPSEIIPLHAKPELFSVTILENQAQKKEISRAAGH